MSSQSVSTCEPQRGTGALGPPYTPVPTCGHSGVNCILQLQWVSEAKGGGGWEV
jgi:hypothetical protein